MSDQTIASAPTTTDADSTEFPGRGVAQVIVDIDAPHLDEPYDYAVPTEFRDTVRVGSQVQVRFGRRRVSGYVVGLSASSSFSGKLAPILRVVTPLPVLSKPLLETINYLSLRYCATRSQLLSFVVPTRRARVEKSFEDAIATARSAREGIFQEPATALLPPSQVERKVITALPGDRQKMLTNLVSEIAALGATALVLAPTAASSQQICGELEQSPGLRVGHIDAEQSADRRYRVYLQALLGRFDVLVGSRSAVWTPLPNLHTIVIWDDGDDRYREQRAPRLDALDVAVARSHVEHVALVCLSYARSIKAQALVETGWASEVVPPGDLVRSTVPRVAMFDGFSAEREGATGFTRLPDAAYRMIRKGLAEGPVLVSVPAAGSVTETESGYFRVGSDRVRDELERAFPGVQVVVSSSTGGVVRSLEDSQGIVVSTPGVEPRTSEGYSSIVITGASGVAYRDSLDGSLDALRRWMEAAALAAPKAPLLLVGEVPMPLLDSLVYWRPQILAHDEWMRRQELGFPPARWTVAIEGNTFAVEAELAAAEQSLGVAQARFPGEEWAPLTLVSHETRVGDDGHVRERVVLSVAPRNIRRLMVALGEARRELSRNGRELPGFDINPSSLVNNVR